MDSYLKDKKVLVTGAGSGIGRAVVKKLVSLGCYVVAASQNEAKLKSLVEECGATGSRITIVQVDLSSWSETDQKLASLCQDLDYLINNAGYGYTAPVDKLEEAEVQKCLNINLVAPMNLIRLVAPGMKERRSGAIVNVSSVSGIAAINDQTVYGASKGGLDMVTKVAAKELGPYNVRVNSINPTVVWTEMAETFWQGEKKDEMMSKIPMNRFVEMSEIVDPIIFLLKPGAGMVNGIKFVVDGGFVAT